MGIGITGILFLIRRGESYGKNENTTKKSLFVYVICIDAVYIITSKRICKG